MHLCYGGKWGGVALQESIKTEIRSKSKRKIKIAWIILIVHRYDLSWYVFTANVLSILIYTDTDNNILHKWSVLWCEDGCFCVVDLYLF